MVHRRDDLVRGNDKHQVLRNERQDPIAERVAPPPNGAVLRHAELTAQDRAVDRFQLMRIVAGSLVDVAGD
jgi:hypothetical protein